jgi:hypothetical protein
MNKEEYDKLSTFDKIDFDIAMKMYMEHNSTIATINDNLGDMYSYRDLEEAERLEEHDELEEYKKALKEKCDAIDKAIEKLKQWYCSSEEVIKILKGGTQCETQSGTQIRGN